MAYSKNIVQHNIWGITKYEYSSSTSSPLWTILLTASYFIFGVNDYIPFILNIIFSVILVIVLYIFLKKFPLSNFFSGLVLITIIVILPISIHVFSGMEHILHSIFTVLFLYLSIILLCESDIKKKLTSSLYYLLITALFLTSVRYEGIFLVLIVSLLFIVRKKKLLSLSLIILSLIPATLIGIKSILNSSYFLPNSILLKNNFSLLLSYYSSLSFFEDINIKLIMNVRIILLLTLSVILFILQLKLKKQFWSRIPLLLFLFISITLVQKIISTQTYFRYDTYLIITGIAINSIAFYDYFLEKFNIKIDFNFLRKNNFAKLVILLLIAFFITKEFYFNKTITATKNIYEQQYQMSRFLEEYYSEKGVAANDIGAINYFSDIRCLDLMGMGNLEIARERINNTFNVQRVKEISKKRNVKIAIVYDEWFDKIGGLPSEWIKVGEWKITNNFICGSDRVSFYAVDKEERNNLIQNLKKFSQKLPGSVIQSGEYTLSIISK